MKSTTVRRVTLSIAVVTALAGVAACGSSGGSGGSGDGKGGGGSLLSPVAALRLAAKSTDKADSAKVRSVTSIGSVMSMTSNGALSWGDGLTGTLTITYTGGTAAETMRKLGTESMEARYLPDAYYAKMSDKFAQQMGGKHWVRYGYDALARMGGASGAYLKDQMQNTTPNQSVKLLLASGDVKKVGTDTVSGKHATHYAGTVDVADLAGKSSSLSASQLAAMKKQLTQAGVSTETVDLWIDDEDLLVKAVSKADMSVGRMVQTTYYGDYGVKVSTQKPPASDTKDVSDLMKSTGTLGGVGTTS